MNTVQEGLYAGSVMHRRLRPRHHRFRYRVFTLFADLDSLDKIDRRLWFFSHNRFNLFSLHDRDLGNGDDLRAHLDAVAEETAGPDVVQRFLVLCYPRVLGYAFNPLTVYFGVDRNDRTAVVIYEVSNTFGERHTYATARGLQEQDAMRHACDKVFHVSPFNRINGRYLFRTRRPDRSAAVGILLSDDDGALLAAHFSGTYEKLSDANLIKQFVRLPLMTHKVWLGIRWEALRLWVKGLAIFHKPEPPVAPVCVYRKETQSKADDLAA